jgi:hypothetical protein
MIESLYSTADDAWAPCTPRTARVQPNLQYCICQEQVHQPLANCSTTVALLDCSWTNNMATNALSMATPTIEHVKDALRDVEHSIEL